MMATEGVSPRGRRYDLSSVREVQRLNEAGWSHREIQRILIKEHGHAPHLDTLARWLSPSYAENARKRQLVSGARYRERLGYSFAMPGHKTRAYQEAFVLRLREEQLWAASIAKVCTVVFGEPWSRDRVRKILEDAGV